MSNPAINLFFDTETSGFISNKKDPTDPTQAWCVQLAAILTNGINEVETLNVLIKPNGRKIPIYATNVHGITVEKAQAHGIEEVEALELFASMMNPVITQICHNYRFDSQFIDHMFQRNMDKLSDEARSKFFFQLPHFCTMSDKRIVNFCGLKNKANRPKWPKLEELYEILFGEVFENAHDALADVRATVACYYELIERGVIDV